MKDSPNVWLEQRAIIEFLVVENIKPINIQRRSLVVYEN